MCSFPSKFISSQFATLDKMENYAEEIAPARTFVFVRDIVPLLNANLIKGGDLDNAIVIYEKPEEQAQLDKLADLLKVPHIDAAKLDISSTSHSCGTTNARAISSLTSLATWP